LKISRLKINSAVLRILGNILGAVAFFGALAYLFALLFQPQWESGPIEITPAAFDASQLRSSAQGLEAEPVQYHVPVDYARGSTAPWWPKNESPILAELVAEGILPPVDERLGPEPLVMEGPEGIGNYGGTWLRLAESRSDALGFATSRLASPALIRWSPQGYPLVPHLARDWEGSEDQRVWTIRLRQGIRWSDGHPVTSADLLFSEEARKEIGGRPPRYLLQAGGEVGTMERIDAHTVRFHFPEPNPLFPESLAREARVLLPSHYLSRYLPESGDPEFLRREANRLNLPNARTLYRDRASASNPDCPSLAPWIYAQDQPAAPYLFVRNPYYWAVDTQGNQLPYIDQVQFGERSRAMLAASAYEGSVSMQQRHLRFDDYTLLMSNREAQNYKVFHWTDAGTPWVIFPNLNRAVRANEPAGKWKAALLRDPRFRQALSLGIDREEIIEVFFSGVGEPSQPAPYPTSPYYDPDLKRLFTEFDSERANQLLDEVGLNKRDAEGFRTFPDGSRMTWFLDYGGFIDRGATPFVVDYWQRLGLRTIERARSGNLLATERKAMLQDFRIYDVFNIPLLEVAAFVPTTGNNSFAMAYGNWFEHGGLDGVDLSGEGTIVQEPEPGSPIRRAMELYARALTTIDEEERIQLFRQVLEISAENVWAIAINSPPPVLTIVRDGFRNVAPSALAAFTFLSVSNIGPETYFFDDPTGLTPGARARLKEWLTPKDAGSTIRDEEVVAEVSAPSKKSFPGWIIGLAFVGALGLAAMRYPVVGRRCMVLVPTLTVMSLGIFWIIQIPPGDFVQMRIAELEAQGDVSAAEEVEELRELFHLDEPVFMQYLRWTGLYWFVSFRPEDTGLLQGNLGRSMATLQPVNEMVGDRLLLTILISIGTILFTYAMAIPIGIYSAIRQYSVGDYFFTIVGFLGLCIPNFLLALLLMYFSSRFLGIDATGLFSPDYAMQPEWSMGKFLDLLKHIWIPVVVVGTSGTAGMIRVMRGNLIEELRKPYVVTARAKGVRPASLILRYPVRLAINPFISGIGSIFPRLVSGEAIVAIVISLPTVGPMLLTALLSQDMYMAGSLLMFLSVLGVIGTLVSDLLLMACDPRIRVEQ
jgi:ABC-type dipeptide/oligopeptide/nickel transport system permease component/ABC-type transport system substrate-binding protein